MSEELLHLKDVRNFGLRGVPWREARAVKAVDSLDFVVRRGETVGLVGESGSGKSTLARVATRLLDPTHGRVEIGGADVTKVRGRKLRPYEAHHPSGRVGAGGGRLQRQQQSPPAVPERADRRSEQVEN